VTTTTYKCPLILFALLVAGAVGGDVEARDYFLTIGGGSGPESNQVSLEKNVLLLRRTIEQQSIENAAHDIFFADGDDVGRDVKLMDPDSLPKAHRLMAEFFGDDDNLGLTYRDHEIKNVRGKTSPKNIRNWFAEVGNGLAKDDRLFIYVTAHGNRSKSRRAQYDTTIAMWDKQSLTMTEMVELLDGMNQEVDVVVVMVQCYAGGFARLIFNEGDPEKGLSPQRRVGFFATVHDKPASGCTPEVYEANYVEYSSSFWPAFTGKDRTGKRIERPDYDRDGVVSFAEAHAFTLLDSNTIDIPAKTSGEFLSVHGKFGKDDSELLTDRESYETVLQLASPTQKAVLEGLSEQLGLSGTDRITAAARQANGRSRRRRAPGGQRGGRDLDRLRQRIASDIEERWPELGNVLNPVAVSLLTDRSKEFIRAIESHADYSRYRSLTSEAEKPNEEKRTAKFHRFLRTADNVVFAENLKRSSDSLYRQYQTIVEGESQSLKSSR